MVMIRAALAMSQAHMRNTEYLTEPPLSGIMNQQLLDGAKVVFKYPET
jgi:hypothetical protein